MLEVIFYQSTEDLIKDEDLSENPLIICPSPIVADGLRRLMSEKLEVVTISKWVSDYLKTSNLKRSNKSELMLRLSSVWRHYFPTKEAHLFLKAFEIFTDLRSFTLSLEMLSEFIKELDDDTAKSILIFWTFLENEKIIDEQLSYQLISANKFSRPFRFIGFKHLSGIQIDMLKTISEQVSVDVFFPKNVYAESLSTDWIRWLLPEKKLEISTEKKKLNVVYFPKNKLNIVLDSIKSLHPNFDLALASQHVNLNSRQEVALENLFYKSPEDLFQVKRIELLDNLNEELKDESIDLKLFLEKIEIRKSKSLEVEDYVLYKVLLLLEDALSFYSEFQSTLDSFALKILKLILELNSPRVSLATITINPENRLLELNELPYREGEHPLVLVASSNYGALKSQDEIYSEKMLEILRSIAPVKRAGLEFSYQKNELIQTLSNNKNLLLMEEGLDMVDLSWREILKDFDLELVNSRPNYKLKNQKDYLSSLLKPGPYVTKNISASRLQVFIDCPRKYYFTYIDKIDHRPEERLKIAPDEMGTIEHEIIEQYFSGRKIEENLEFDSKLLEEQCLKSLQVFLTTNHIALNEKTKLSTYYELLHYTQNGIEFLIKFINENSGIEIEFEHRLNNNHWGLVGSIDCLVHLGDGRVAVFDFKRSGAAIGSKRDTMAFDKLQIWTYLIIVQQVIGKQVHSWGYLNLSEIEDSQVHNENEVIVLSAEKMKEFQMFLEKIIEEIKNEINYKASPRVEKVCDFCEVQLLCSKGSSNL